MNEAAPKISIRAVLISEDLAWAESNKRPSLINIYSGAHLVHGSFPLPFQVGVTLVVVVEKGGGAIPVELEFSGDSMDAPVKFQGEVVVDLYTPPPERPEISTVPLGVIALRIARPGGLEIKCKLPQEDWKLHRVYRFKHKPHEGIVIGDSSSAGSSLSSTTIGLGTATVTKSSYD